MGTLPFREKEDRPQRGSGIPRRPRALMSPGARDGTQVRSKSPAALATVLHNFDIFTSLAESVSFIKAHVYYSTWHILLKLSQRESTSLEPPQVPKSRCPPAFPAFARAVPAVALHDTISVFSPESGSQCNCNREKRRLGKAPGRRRPSPA